MSKASSGTHCGASNRRPTSLFDITAAVVVRHTSVVVLMKKLPLETLDKLDKTVRNCKRCRIIFYRPGFAKCFSCDPHRRLPLKVR